MELNAFLNLVDDPDVSEEDFRHALGTVLQSANDVEGRERVLSVLIQGLQASTSRSTLLAVACGFLVEQGASTALLEQPLYAYFTKATRLALDFHARCSAALPSDAEDEAFATQRAQLSQVDANGAAGWDALEDGYFAAIALLSRSTSARRSWKDLTLIGQMNQLRSQNAGAHWLWKMLQVLDDEPFLVIEPTSGMGISGRMSGVAENFQLNVLLMNAFPRGLFTSRRVSQQAVAVANGSGPQTDQETIIGQWDLVAWRGVNEAMRPSKEKPVTTNWIWNEGVPADIPVFEGHRVILLGPASYRRTWNSQRAFASMSATLAVERTLSAAESRAWLNRMSAAVAR